MDRHDREIQWLITMVNGNCLITVREDQIISMQMAEIRRLIEGGGGEENAFSWIFLQLLHSCGVR